MANRADVYLGKGNLDAALKDYNDVLAPQSRTMCAPMPAAASSSSGGAT